MYSPETLLQIHHLRHEELVAAARRSRVGVDPRVRRGANLLAGRPVRRTVTDAQRALTGAVARVTAPLAALTGARPGSSSDPACCPA